MPFSGRVLSDPDILTCEICQYNSQELASHQALIEQHWGFFHLASNYNPPKVQGSLEPE